MSYLAGRRDPGARCVVYTPTGRSYRGTKLPKPTAAGFVRYLVRPDGRRPAAVSTISICQAFPPGGRIPR